MNTALCCFALMVFIVAASGQTLVEQDHDHHEDETTFNHLAEITGSFSEDFIDIPAIENLLARFKTRVECAANQACETCLTYETVRSILNISENVTSFDEHEFARPAALILTMLANDTCTGIDSNVVGSSAIICGPDVITTIRSIAPRYHGSENNTKCFNYATVIGQNCTEHVDDIHYKLLVNLYEGQCILPTPTDMESELFESLGVEGEIVTDVVFTTLLSKLNIGTLNNGSSSTSTVPTDTDHSSHNHRRKRSSHDHDEHEHEKRCYTYDQLKAIYGYTSNMSRGEMLSVSPAVLQQVISDSCVTNTTVVTTPAPVTSTYTTAQKYGYGTAAVAVISLLAFVGVIFFPTLKSEVFKLITQFFIALGVGTLSGDALLHIIPEVLGIHAHTPGEEHKDDFTYLYKLVVVIAGLYMLYLFENIVKVVRLHRLKKKNGPDYDLTAISHGHSHGHHQVTPTSIDSNATTDNDSCATEELMENKAICFGINSVSLMVCIGDAFHNFGDGIAIGAAFSQNWVTGLGTSLAIFCHELPHEFADFAIYINNGLQKWKALMLNFASACCCFIGLYVGLAISNDTEVRQWLLAVVAGMFIYISLVDILNEMVNQRSNDPILQFCIQNFGMVLGWVILFLIAYYEDRIVNSFSATS